MLRSGGASITLYASISGARSICILRSMGDKTPYLRNTKFDTSSECYSSISHNLTRYTFRHSLSLEADNFRISFRLSTSPFNSLRSVSSLRPSDLTLQHHGFTLPLCNSLKSHIFSAHLSTYLICTSLPSDLFVALETFRC